MSATETAVVQAVSERKMKRLQVSCACQECRGRKTKCCGTRPSCKTCQQRGTVCVYVMPLNETRTSALKRQLLNAQRSEDAAQQMLARLLSAPEVQAYRYLTNARNSVQTLEGHDTFSLPVLPSQPQQSAPSLAEIESSRSSSQGPDRAVDVTKSSAEADKSTPAAVAEGSYAGSPRNSSPADIILEALTVSSNRESSALLGRLRMGHSWRDLATYVTGGRHLEGYDALQSPTNGNNLADLGKHWLHMAFASKKYYVNAAYSGGPPLPGLHIGREEPVKRSLEQPTSVDVTSPRYLY